MSGSAMPDFRRFVARRLPRLDLPAPRAAEVREELAEQLEACYADALARGLDPAAARAQAERQVPDWAAFAVAVEAAEGPAPASGDSASAVGSIRQDVKHGLRVLRRRPAFSPQRPVMRPRLSSLYRRG